MHSEIEQSEPTAPSSEQAAKDGKPAAAEGADRAAPLHGVVEEVLRRALRGVEHVERADGDVRAALRLASTAAQSRGLHAEQLLVLLKEGWRQLPEAQRMALRSRADADAALARMITLCIEEYYAPSVRQ